MKSLKLRFTVITIMSFFYATNAFSEGTSIKSTEGRVVVTVTYKNPGKRVPAFEVKMSSNVINLRKYNLGSLSVLRDDKGKEYEGEWAPITKRRRKSSGTLVFKGIDWRHVKEIELIIKNVGRTEERIFKWPVQISG